MRKSGGVAHSALDPYFRLFWFEFAVMLSVVTFAVHIWGYRYIGAKYQNRVLASAAKWIAINAICFGIALMTGIALFSFGMDDQIMNYVIGLFVLILLIAYIPFIWAMIQIRRQIPSWAYLALGVLVFPFSIWQSWLTIIFLIPSIALFFRLSKS